MLTVVTADCPGEADTHKITAAGLGWADTPLGITIGPGAADIIGVTVAGRFEEPMSLESPPQTLDRSTSTGV